MASGTIQKYADGTDSGWIDLTDSDHFDGKMIYRKTGNIFQLKSSGWNKAKAQINAGGYYTLATIPSVDRPTGILIGFAYVNASPFPLVTIKVESGAITLFNSSSTNITTSTSFSISAIGFFS